MSKEIEKEPLIGNFFHTLVNDVICWQGIVNCRPEPGIYLVILFSWISGEQTHKRLVKIEDMKDWLFYSDEEWMKFSYENGVAYHYRSDKRNSKVSEDKEEIRECSVGELLEHYGCKDLEEFTLKYPSKEHTDDI